MDVYMLMQDRDEAVPEIIPSADVVIHLHTSYWGQYKHHITYYITPSFIERKDGSRKKYRKLWHLPLF